MDNFATAVGVGNARITVYGSTSEGAVYGESAGIALSVPGTSPVTNTPDGMAQVTGWNGQLNNSSSLFIIRVIIVFS